MPVTFEYDIFRPQYGGLRIECLVEDCHFALDFDDPGNDKKTLLRIKRALQAHMATHGLRLSLGSMRVSE